MTEHWRRGAAVLLLGTVALLAVACPSASDAAPHPSLSSQAKFVEKAYTKCAGDADCGDRMYCRIRPGAASGLCDCRAPYRVLPSSALTQEIVCGEWSDCNHDVDCTMGTHCDELHHKCLGGM